MDQKFVTDTAEFQEIQERLRNTLRKGQEQGKSAAKRPSLQMPEPEPAECQEILQSSSTERRQS